MLLIKNALLPDFDTLTTTLSDLLIENGRFSAIAPQLTAQCETLDAHGMLRSGVRVGFGCDGEASSANRDLLREARHGSYLQKVLTLDPTVLPAGQCYRMLTEVGMGALGYDDLGRIAVGCQADFSLVRTDDLSTTNRRRILTNLLYAGSGSQIDSVFVQGRPVLRGGSFVHHDIGKVLEQCERILARLEEKM